MGLFKELWHKGRNPESKKLVYVQAPISGKVKPLHTLNDGVFSEELLGKGCVIETENETITAPFNGKIVMTTESKHAIGLISDDGIELLLHVGIDTVTMEGEGFQLYVEKDERIKKGQCLLSFSKAKIKSAGFTDDVIVIVTNTSKFKDVHCLNEGGIQEQECLLCLSV